MQFGEGFEQGDGFGVGGDDGVDALRGAAGHDQDVVFFEVVVRVGVIDVGFDGQARGGGDAPRGGCDGVFERFGTYAYVFPELAKILVHSLIREGRHIEKGYTVGEGRGRRTGILDLMACAAEHLDGSYELLRSKAGVQGDEDLDDLNGAGFGVFDRNCTHCLAVRCVVR